MNDRRFSSIKPAVVRPVSKFLRAETTGGIVLLIGTVAALVWANSPAAHSYETFLEYPLHLMVNGHGLEWNLHEWVNDGLMTLFFLVVGLEIKRELVEGELRDPKTAAVPVLAALGGMVVPALIYISIAGTTGIEGRGWGIPMATDIAFAVGVLALLGSRIPSSLKVFLLTLAIADDIGAIVVIALFYSDGISGPWLALAAFGLLLMGFVYETGTTRFGLLAPIGLVVWFATYEAGIHPTIAGVALGLLTPTTPINGVKPLHVVEERLHPWTAGLVIPLFALMNAGVHLSGSGLADALTSPVTIAVGVGLVAGKIIGVSGFGLASVMLGLGRLPAGMTIPRLFGVASLAGIGFTVALFITELAFRGSELVESAKIGVLAASAVAALLGVGILLLATRKPSVNAAAPEPAVGT